MPLYEYQCTQCNTRTEVLQRLDDAPLATCPACGGPVKKLISSPAFQFKGSGWYVTDYAKKSGASAGKSDSASSGDGDKGSSAGDKGSGGGDKGASGGDAKADGKSGGSASSDAKSAKSAAAPAGKSGGD
jgi:putative FmdB family regulatory protein